MFVARARLLAQMSAGSVTASHLPSQAWASVKGVFCGSGCEGMGSVAIRDAVIALAGKPQPSVLYIGTPTYDLQEYELKQTARFAEAGCEITTLKLTDVVPASGNAESMIRAADVILVSGGNPLYAVARWHLLGIVPLLREAMSSGTVMCGGSCGLISWFDAGHSDSGDPASFKVAMQTGTSPADCSGWEYVRVPCLGFLPGLICPHHDRVQSNGVLRATDFDAMMLRHPGETGVAVDHFSALVLNSGRFRVLQIPNKPGSVGPDGSFVADGSGVPGVWQKTVRDGAVVSRLVPGDGGDLQELLMPAVAIVEDPRIESLRDANPAT